MTWYEFLKEVVPKINDDAHNHMAILPVADVSQPFDDSIKKLTSWANVVNASVEIDENNVTIQKRAKKRAR